MYNIEKIKEDLKKNLSEFRYEHSLLVAKEAKKLAKHYGLDEEKAYVAGLVHDIAKEFSDEENVKYIQKYNLSRDLLKLEYKKIIHADIGAVVVKEKYGFDNQICNAILYHSIGNVKMDDFSKIIFVADKIARKYVDEDIKKASKLAYQNIDDALLFCLDKLKEVLETSGKKMHPNSIQLMELIKNKK